jgi:hypothetical protein
MSMVEAPSPRRPGGEPLSDRPGRRSAGRLVGAIVLTVIGFLIAAGLAPFALHERGARGSVADTAITLIGQAQAATDGLRRLGYACADTDESQGVLIRVCTRVRLIESAQVQLVITPASGEVELVTTRLDEEGSATASHGQVLEVLTDALGLSSADRSKVLAAVDRDAEVSFDVGWGSFTLRPGAATKYELPVEQWESELRAARWDDPPPTPTGATLAGSVDTLANAARDRGYECTTPQVPTIRACTRKEGGYSYHLWMQGTDTYVTALTLDVTATYRTQTRSHWVDEMSVVLTWLDTAHGRNLLSWLAQSADAPGADSYVDGLHISFLVRADEYTKETFGGVLAECGRVVTDISSCEP